MTWLSKIEEDLKDRPIPNPRMDRMARVIRELAGRVSWAQKRFDMIVSLSEKGAKDLPITAAIAGKFELKDNLSTDAKGLLK